MRSLSFQDVTQPSGQSQRKSLRILIGLSLLAFIVSLAIGCAAGTPSIEDEIIKRKFDLRLRMALGGYGTGEPLGDHVRVNIHMRRSVTDEDRQELGRFGTIGSVIGPIVTLTLRPERLVQVAALSRVRFIEFDAGNVPMPIPPSESEPAG